MRLAAALLVFLAERLYALVFTETQNGIRVIGLRKASQREERLYEHAKANPKNDRPR